MATSETDELERLKKENQDLHNKYCDVLNKLNATGLCYCGWIPPQKWIPDKQTSGGRMERTCPLFCESCGKPRYIQIDVG